MNSAFVVKLGSGGAAKHGVGSKGKLLDMSARAGLPVPRGVVILDAAADLAILHGAAEQDSNRLRVIDPAKLVTLLELPVFVRPVAVRSAFSTEDNDDSALAGYFRTVLNVDSTDIHALGSAIEAVWASARLPAMTETTEFTSDSPRVRRDMLVMEMIAATRSGVAFYRTRIRGRPR